MHYHTIPSTSGDRSSFFYDVRVLLQSWTHSTDGWAANLSAPLPHALSGGMSLYTLQDICSRATGTEVFVWYQRVILR